MAKVRAPLFSMEVRGDLAESRFRTWRGMTTVSKAGVGPGQPGQSNFMAMNATKAHWTALTEEEREAWRDYGRRTPINKGIWKPKFWSGYTWARKAAYICGQIGVKPPTLPWETEKPVQPEMVGCYVWNGNGLITYWDPAQPYEFVGVRVKWDHPVTRRFYDYKLGLEQFYPMKSEETVRLATVFPSKMRVAVRFIRETGQWGPAAFRDLYVEVNPGKGPGGDSKLRG